LQALKKRKIGATSRACFLDESDEEIEPEIEPQHLSLLSSQTSTPIHQEGTTSCAATREDTDRSEVCRSSQQECEELSSEGVKADLKEGVEAPGSLSILSGSQIDIQIEMDVLTSSADMENAKVLPALEPVPETAAGIGSTTAGRSQMEAAKWHIDPSLIVVNNDDFDTVVDQLSLGDQESEGDTMKEGTKIVGYSEPGAEGQDRGLVVPTKTKMKKLSIRSPRKYAPMKRLSKSDFLCGNRRRRKIDKVDASKLRRRKKNEEKERIACPPGPSSAESASESNETAPSEEHHKSGAEKELMIDQAVKAGKKQEVVKRSKARRRKCDPDVKDPFSDNGEPKHSLAANEKKPKGRPRKKQHEELPSDCSEDEKLAINDKKPKGRPRKKKNIETEPLVECSEDEELATREKNTKRARRTRKKLPSECSEDEELAISDKKPEGKKRNMESEPLNEFSEAEAVVISDKKPKGRPRKKKTEANKLPNDRSEDEVSRGKKPKGRPRKKKIEVNKLPSDRSEDEDEAVASREKKPRGRPRKHKPDECREPLAMDEKNTQGRRRNKGKEDHPSNSYGESATNSETTAKGRPRKRKREDEQPSDSSEPVAKKFRKPGKRKSEDKPLSERSELKLSPVYTNFEHQVSEDSGYPSSSINSRSPTDCVLMSPINMKHNTDFLQEDSFQETSNPILYDSNFGISKPETDIGSDIETSQGLDISQGEAGVEYSSLLHGMQPAFGGSTEIESSNVLYDLDLLLGQEPTIFGFDSNPNMKLESSSEVDDILRSPSVSSCIRDLQRSGALPCGDSPQLNRESHTGQPPNFIATVTQVSVPLFSELVSGSQIAESSSEDCWSSDVIKVSGDSNPSCVDSTCSQKVAGINSCQRRRKPALPILPPSMQTKSGRRLKRSWKLCSDDPDLEMALKRSAEENEAPEKIMTDSKEKSTSDECECKLDALHPELCSTNAPLSGKACKQVMENTAAKGDSGSVNGVKELVTDLPLSTGQETQESKDENILTSSMLRNKDGDKGGGHSEIITSVKPRTSGLKASLRTVKVKLKRRCAKALCPNYSHCSGGSRPESDGPPSSKVPPPPPLGNDMNESLPKVHSSLNDNVGGADEEQPTAAKDLCSTSTLVSHTSPEKESEREDMPSREEKEVFTSNGLIYSDKKPSFFSRQKTFDGDVNSGGIFGSRMGSIFADSQAVSTSGNYIMPQVTNDGTTNLKSRLNSASSRELHNRTTPSAAHMQKSHSTSSLSLSLDKVLKQMGEVKDSSSVVNTFKASEFKPSLSSSRRVQNLPGASGMDTTSSFEKGEVALGRIQYNSPSAYRASLASSAISDLILAPLNVGETLDEELKGESLFDSDTKDDCKTTESLLATSKEAQEMRGETRTEIASQYIFDEPTEAYDRKSKPTDAPPSTQNLDDIESGRGDRIETVIPFKEPKSPPMLRKIHLSGMETEGEEVMEEDCISLFPREDDDLLGGEVDEEPLAKFYAKCPKLTKSSGTGVANKASIRRRPVESHRGYSPPPLDDGGFGSSFEKRPTVVPLKSQQVSQWVADQQKRKTTPSQAPRAHLPSSTGRPPLIHLDLKGGGLRNPWGPSSRGNSHGVPHGNAAHVQANGSASPGPFVATNLPQG
jgi:hypothetical protein